MGYFEIDEGIIVGDRQTDIVDDAIKEKFGEEYPKEIFKNVMADHEFCKDVYEKVKEDFRVPGRTMTKKEFCGHLIFCLFTPCRVSDVLDKVKV